MMPPICEMCEKDFDPDEEGGLVYFRKTRESERFEKQLRAFKIMPGIYKSAIMPENWSISSCRLSKFAPDENVRALKPSLVIIDCKCSLDISKSSTTAKVALDGAEFVAGRSSIGFRGSKILNSVPTPTVLVTCSAPPSLSTLRLATDKPIPAPGKRWPVECSPR